MSFFTSSSGLTIYGGNFTSINLPTQDAATTQVIKERGHCEFDADGLRKKHRKKHRKRHLCSSRDLDGLMIVKADEVHLHRELIRGISYRIHSASHDGRLVAVKTFEGLRAKQDWTIDLALSKLFLHPNLLKIVGASDERSKSHFVLFHGITSEQKMQSLIAKALGTDLNTSVQISMKAVKGIAAGLSYIDSQNIHMHAGTMNNNQKWENFDIFTGYDNEPIISFNPSSTVHEDGSVSQTFDNKTDGRGVEMLNGLCQQLFSGANSILYDDSPERKFDANDREGPPTVTPTEYGESTNPFESESMSNPSSSMGKPKSSRTPRREVWWLDLGATNQSLESIKQRFEACLDRPLFSSSNSLLRRITSPMDNNLRWNLHQCPGYLREEITLTSDVSKSVIISHAFPSQSEVCSICGQLVQYTYSEPSITDGEERETDSSSDSRHVLPSNQLQPSGSLSPHSSIHGPPSPVLSDSDSILSSFPTIPPSPTFSNHSGRLATLQLHDNKPEENPSAIAWEKVKNTFSRAGSSTGRRSRTNSILTWKRRDNTDSSVSRESGASSRSAKTDKADSVRSPHLMQSPSASASIPPADLSKYQNAKLFPFPGMLRLEEERRARRAKGYPPASSPHSPLYVPPSPVLSDSDSMWNPPSPTLSNHSGRSATLQLHDNKPEEDISTITWEKVKDTFRRAGSSSGRRSRTNSILTRKRWDNTDSSVSRESGASLMSAKTDKADSVPSPVGVRAPHLMQSPSASASILSPIPLASSADLSKYQNAKLFPFPGMLRLEEERRAKGYPPASASSPDVSILSNFH